MHVVKKLAIDIGLSVLLLIPTLAIAVIVNINRPDCITCGSNIGLTFWMASISALQPVIWTQDLSKAKRFGIWAVALLAGVIVYLLSEAIASLALRSGFVAGALAVGFLANLIGVFSALLVSLMAVRRVRREGKGRALASISS